MKKHLAASKLRHKIYSFLFSVLVSSSLGTVDIAAEQVGIVTVDKLNVRPEPGTHKPPITTLKRGTEVTIEDKRNGWLKVRIGDRIGYIQNRSKYVHIMTMPHAKDDAPESQGRQKIHKYRQEAENLNRKIDEAAARVRKFTDRETGILRSLDDLDYAIAQAGKTIKSHRNELAQLKEKIKSNQRIYKELTDRIDANQVYATKRLVTLYKLSNMGTMPVLASSSSIFEMLQSKNSLERILAHDEQVRQRLVDDEHRLKKVLDHLAAQQAQKEDLEISLRAEIQKMSKDRIGRSHLLAKIQSEKSLQLAALESMKITAKKLDRTIESFAASPRRDTQNKIGSLGSFSKHKGLLNMPIKGKIISFFGPQKNTKFNVTVFRSGIDIKAKKGAIIQAVYGGRVLFADWFKGYGNMIIIDHGESYYTVYAHLEDLYTQKGTVVTTGEDIATIGEMATAEGPVLHFEVRHHGKPLDALQWITTG